MRNKEKESLSFLKDYSKANIFLTGIKSLKKSVWPIIETIQKNEFLDKYLLIEEHEITSNLVYLNNLFYENLDLK